MAAFCTAAKSPACVDSGALVELLADWEPPPLPVSVAYPSSRHMSAKLRAFVDWTVEVFAPYGSIAP
jgi:LysR family transcriptional regulator for bpeEF and oprC